MYKGIVMKIEDKIIVVMRSTGQIDRIERGTRTCNTGQEIMYTFQPKASIKGLLIAVVGLTAVLAVCFFFVVRMLGVSASTNEVIAYVSIDINPSVEIGIDENEIVRELKGLNADGEQLAKSITYEDKSLDQVVTAILDKEEQGSLKAREGDIVIASATTGDHTKLSDVVLSTKLKQQVTDHLKMTHPTNANAYIVASFAVPYELKAAADNVQLSMGKYAIYLHMKSLGSNMTTEQFAAKQIFMLAKENKTLKAELASGQSFSKTALSALLKEEKSGTLGGKKETDDGLPTVTPNPNKTPTPKPTPTPKSSVSPTPKPTVTPKPSGSPGATGTPKPGGSPGATVTPKPGGSPGATVTPKPTPVESVKPSPKA